MTVDIIFTIILPFLSMFYQMQIKNVCYGFPLCFITTVEIIPGYNYNYFIWTNYFIDFIFWFVIIRIIRLIYHRLTG